MQAEARAARPCLVLGLVLAMGCGPARVLTRPEGNGGWDPQRRRDELSARATAAAVALDPEAPPPEPENIAAPLSLTDALAIATSGNRRIAEADREVDAAAARVRDTRGRLLPATTGSGRYTWYTSALRNAVALPAGVLPGATNPSFVIREQQSGRLNGATVIPLDVTGQLWKTLTAAQAGYRGERARAWATTLAQKVGVIRAYFDLLQARAPARASSSRTIELDRAQLANASNATTPGGSPRTSCWSCRWRCSNREQEHRQRELDDRSGALDAEPGDRPPGRRADGGGRRRPSVPRCPRSTTRCAIAFANNPVLLSLLEEQQRLEDTATALARGRLPRFEGGGTVDWTERADPPAAGNRLGLRRLHLGPRHRRPPRGAASRRRASRPTRNRIAIERELRELESAVRDDAARRRGAARGARHGARPPSVRPRRICASASSSSTPAAPRATTCSTPRPCSRSSAPRSPPRSTRRTRAAPSCRS